MSAGTGSQFHVPPCARPLTSPCPGPPATLPCAEADVGRAVADHVNRCRPCRATLTRCVRDSCSSAWGPFETLVERTARQVVGGLVRDGWPLGSVGREEALGVAQLKGMALILDDVRCSPERTITDGDPRHKALTPLLRESMGNAVRDWRRRRIARGTWDGPVESIEALAARSVDLPAPGADVEGAVVLDAQVHALGAIIDRYRRTLDPARAFVFQRWLEARVNGERAPQRQIAVDLFAILGTRKNQSTVSRWITRFEVDLLDLVGAAGDGLDDLVREIARRLIHPEAPSKEGGDLEAASARGRGSRRPARQPPIEGHDD